jgi:ACS family glucarate transporter-like MFS transporter
VTGLDQSQVSASAEPTGIRHRVLALTTLMAVLLYLDRVCISVTAPLMVEEFCLNTMQVGLLFSVFFFAYALAQVPAGWLGDRLGPRLILTGSVLAWSLATGLTGLMNGLAGLLVVRLVFGISQAGAYPIAARINSLWIPFPRRAFASSMVALGGRLGGALAPVVTALLLVAFGGWRAVFWYYALLGAGWSIVFWRGFRATPADHPECNDAEAHLIESSLPPESTSPHGSALSIPWAAVCRSLGLWMQCLMQLFSNIAWVFLITWMPTYLMEEYGLEPEPAGALSSLPLFAGMCGCFLGGIVTDRLTRRLGLKWGRNGPGLGSKLAAAAGLMGAVAAQDPVLATAALAFAAFATDMGLGATWAYFQDTGGPYVGTMLGWANMFGNLGAFISPILLGGLRQAVSWQLALTVGAAMYLLAGLCWLGMDARVPIVPRAAEH